MEFEIRIENVLYLIELEENTNLFSQNSFIQYIKQADDFKNDEILSVNDLNLNMCFYHGKIHGVSDSAVALSVCDGLVLSISWNFFNTL